MALGGDGTPEGYGATLRTSLDEARQAADVAPFSEITALRSRIGTDNLPYSQVCAAAMSALP